MFKKYKFFKSLSLKGHITFVYIEKPLPLILKENRHSYCSFVHLGQTPQSHEISPGTWVEAPAMVEGQGRPALCARCDTGQEQGHDHQSGLPTGGGALAMSKPEDTGKL